MSGRGRRVFFISFVDDDDDVFSKHLNMILKVSQGTGKFPFGENIYCYSILLCVVPAVEFDTFSFC